jgi:hypothetical protein
VGVALVGTTFAGLENIDGVRLPTSNTQTSKAINIKKNNGPNNQCFNKDLLFF